MYLLPHFFPIGLRLMLHRLGMLIAIAGFTPASRATGESNTAQRHFGAVLIKALTFVQHIGGTLALAFPPAPKHRHKLRAAERIGVLPHSPAALTFVTKACVANKYAINRVAKPKHDVDAIRDLVSCFLWLKNVEVYWCI